MKLSRKWLLVIALVMSLTMATAGTLAYLTDRDSEANVFTLGNVDIELNEEFEQGATLLPGQKIEKKPTITNTGKNDAWVWATIAVPATLDTENDASKNVLHFNYAKESVGNGLWTWQDENGWMVESDVEIDGKLYNVYTVLYQTPLKAGETTEYPVMTQVYLDTHVDVTPDGEMYWVEGGEATKLDWNVLDDELTVYVSAYAIQTTGFKTVQEAYEAYAEQWGDNGTEWGTPATSVSTAAELEEALANDENVVLAADITTDENIILNGGEISGAGYTLTKEYDGSASSNAGIQTTGGKISNLTIENGTPNAAKGLRAIYVVGKVTENVVVDNCVLDATYPINVNTTQMADYSLIVTNSTLNGWTSYSPIKAAVFTNCEFGESSNGYANLRPYSDTTLTGCNFAEGFTITANNTVGKTFTITLNDCTVNGTAVTAANFQALLANDDGDNSLKNHSEITVVVDGKTVVFVD